MKTILKLTYLLTVSLVLCFSPTKTGAIGLELGSVEVTPGGYADMPLVLDPLEENAAVHVSLSVDSQIRKKIILSEVLQVSHYSNYALESNIVKDKTDNVKKLNIVIYNDPSRTFGYTVSENKKLSAEKKKLLFKVRIWIDQETEEGNYSVKLNKGSVSTVWAKSVSGIQLTDGQIYVSSTSPQLNEAPTISVSENELFLTAGETKMIYVDVDDPDGGKVRLLVNPPDVGTFEESEDLVPYQTTITLTATDELAAAGQTKIRITARDDGDPSMSQSVAITVNVEPKTSQNKSPIISSVDPDTTQQIAVEETVTFEVTATDTDGDLLEFSSAPSDAIEITSTSQLGNTATALFTFTGSTSNLGTNKIQLIVSDGTTQVTKIITIEVNKDDQPIPEPDIVYEFDKPTLSDNSWGEMPGGFGGAEPGITTIQNFSGETFRNSVDNQGLSINVRAGEVTFLYAIDSVNTGGQPVLMRLYTRANAKDANVFLVALRGSILTNEYLDGSIAYTAPKFSDSFVNNESCITVIYEPDEGTIFVPVIQVVGQKNPTNVMIDRLEIYKLTTEPYPAEYFSNNMLPEKLNGSSSTNSPSTLVQYEFDKSSLVKSGWSEMPGGFDGETPGITTVQGFIGNTFISSNDQVGLAINVRPGEVTFLYANSAVNTNGNPVLMRLKARSMDENGRLFLVGLKGEIATATNLDGSIAYHSPATTKSFVDKEKDMVILYQPDDGELITPVIQVLGGSGGPSTIYIDRMDVYELKAGEYYDSELFRALPGQ